MILSRLLLAWALLIVATVTALGQVSDYRWTSGFAQGTIENMIQSRNGTRLNMYYPSGQMDPTPGMFLTVRGRDIPGQVTIQFVVDGDNHAFYFTDGSFRAVVRLNAESMISFCRVLIRSRASSFIVEVPQIGISDRLSLLNARQALGKCEG